MFLTVREGKVFTNRNGQRYGGGTEIDVDDKTGESLIRNEIATWSENPRWRAVNFKARAIVLKNLSENDVNKNIYNSLAENTDEEEKKENMNPVPLADAPAGLTMADETPKKLRGRPPKNKE